MKNLMRQAKKMQDEMTRTQEALSKKIVENSAGGESVKVEINCKHEIISLEIDKKVIDPNDPDMLIGLIMIAINGATKQIKEITEKELSKLTGELVIPNKIKMMKDGKYYK